MKYQPIIRLSSNPVLLLLGITLFTGLLFTLNSASAQEPSGATATSGKANFYQIQKQFNDYWKGRKISKGSGYKPFKRWEWYWEPRVNPDGTFPPNNVVVKEWERYSAEKPVKSTAGDWKAIGPDKPPTAEQQNFYFGTGRINCMAFHPTDSNIFWVGTPAGGLWRTNDFGKTWTTRYDFNPVLGVSDIVINKEDPLIMYIATGDYDGGGTSTIGSINNMGNGDTKSIGVLKSTDGGQTWQNTQLQWEIKDEYLISRLVVHPDSSNILYAATSVGIYKTANAGKYWARLDTTINADICDIAFNPGNPKIIYAATKGYEIAKTNTAPAKYRSGQVFRSTDGGTTWTDSTRFDSVLRIKLAVTPQVNRLVEAMCVNTKEGLKGIYRSEDNGGTFNITVVNVQQPYRNNYLHAAADPSKPDIDNPSGGQGNYDAFYMINPKDSLERWVGGINIWKSSNTGNTFQMKTCWNASWNSDTADVHADMHWAGFHPLQPTTLFVCTDGGIYYSKDGGTKWFDITKGMQIGQIYRISGSYWEPNLILAGFQDNGSAVRTAPETWSSNVTIGGDGTDCLIDWLDPRVQYTQYPEGVFKRTLTGEWSNPAPISSSIKDKNGDPQKGAWITPIVIHPNNPKILYAGYYNIWKTSNRGDKWDSTASLRRLSMEENTLIRVLAISESNPETMWAGTGKQLFKTTNEWNTCDTIQLKKFLPNGKRNFITGIAIHPENPNVVYVTCSGYDSLKVFKTRDGGNNWTNITGNSLPKLPVNCIAYEEDSPEGLYIGTDAGVYYKDSTMSQWIPFNKNLPNIVVTDLEIERISGKIRASTYGRGLWESDLYVAAGLNRITDVEVPRNGGEATGGGFYPSGKKVTMTATPFKNNSFQGWFENGVKVDSAASFTFTVEGNRNLVAKFGYPIGMEDMQKSRIHLFPNPTKGLVEVQFDKGVGDDLQKTTVTSMQGKTVYESAAKVENDRFSVDLSAHPQGSYLITFYFKSGEKVSYTLLITR